MNTLKIKGGWNITKDERKQKWTKVTSGDLHFVGDKSYEAKGRIQRRAGENWETIGKIIKDTSETRK